MLRRISIPMAVSVLAIVLAFTAIVVQLPPLLTALLSPTPDSDDPRNVIERYLEEHAENQTLDRDRFNGRYLFYPPPTWPRPLPPPREPRNSRKPPPTPPPPTEPTEPETPQVSAVYQGPSVNFALGNNIWFRGSVQGERPFDVRLGEEKKGVNVISVNLPWSVKLGYRGGEYDVDLLSRGENEFFAETPPASDGGSDLMRSPEATEGAEPVAKMDDKPTTPVEAAALAKGESDRAAAGKTEPRPRNPLRPLPAAPVKSGDAGKTGKDPNDRIGFNVSKGRPRAIPRAAPSPPSSTDSQATKADSGKKSAADNNADDPDKTDSETDEDADDGVPPS